LFSSVAVGMGGMNSVLNIKIIVVPIMLVLVSAQSIR
jgi:hypothetical protein